MQGDIASEGEGEELLLKVLISYLETELGGLRGKELHGRLR
jgi:hypothetical protein